MTTMHVASFTSLPAFTRWRIVIMLMVFAGLAHFNRVGITVAGDEVGSHTQVGISDARMVWLSTTCLLVYTIGRLPGGWLTSRRGEGKSVPALARARMPAFPRST